MRKLKYILNDFRWIKALFSPFKPFKIKWYVGKTQIGVPYFLPRKWVKFTEEDIQEAIAKHKANKNYIQHLDDKLYNMYKNYSKAVPLKFGFSYCGLGWKTKWDEYDIRFEHGPVISFVCFGYQIAMMVGVEHTSHYWESWICYEYYSKKKFNRTRKRVAFCRRKCPQKWTSTKDGVTTTTNYWDLILKDKYLYKTQNDHK